MAYGSKVLFAAGASAALLSLTEASSAPSEQEQFSQFAKTFNKQYSEHEREARFQAFVSNLRYIEEQNAKGHSYTLGITEFADMTAEEFTMKKTCMGGSSKKAFKGKKHLGTAKRTGVALPASVDWRTQGKVTPVKNQEQCGSCWAFSTTGSTESAWAIATGKLVSLSEQQLVDCSSSYGNQGCNGGEMDDGFQYEEANAMCTEASYPYDAATGICHKSGCTVGIPQGGIKGYKDVAPDDEQALMEAVAQQPVSVAIEADQMAFQLYSGGVISKGCGASLDHGVLIVGYGTDNGMDYWLVKNSWGASWGENGYVRIERGVAGPGECGIKSQPSYPIVAAVTQTDSPFRRGFEMFIQKYNKVYTPEEREARFAAFVQNLEFITRENAKGHKYRLAINEFADMTKEEFKSTHTCGKALKTKPTFGSAVHTGVFQRSNLTLASSVNWVDAGKVTPVKNQGQCGSCWSFSTTGATESAWAIATGQLVSLSEQQLVDCSGSYGNMGCNGGSFEAAFEYEETVNMCTEASYPYTASQGTCQSSSCTVGIAQGGVTGYSTVLPDDEQALMQAVSQQPVSVAIEADQAAFQLYSGGVLTSQCGDALDHAVLVVGYGTESGVDYWLVKNSWGASWGEGGYVKIQRGVPGPGECGIKSQPAFPTVAGAQIVV